MSMVLKNGDDVINELVRPFQPIDQIKSSSSAEPLDLSGQKFKAPETGQTEGVSGVSQQAFDTVGEQNEKLLLALEEAKVVAETEKIAAFEKGKNEGLAEAVTNDQAKISLLSESSKSAIDLFGKQTDGLEGLAIVMAQTALNKILGPNQGMAELVSQSITQHLDRLKDVSKVQIRVSALDFPDANKLRDLEDQLGRSAIEIVTDVQCESGGCLMKMQLGTVDIGIPGQLKKLNSLLEEMVDGEMQ